MRSFAQRLGASLGSNTEKPPRPLNVLIEELNNDVNQDKLSHAARDDALEQLKTYTRTAEAAAPLCTKQGIQLLCRHGFDHGTAKTSRTALKSLANLMLLSPNTRQLFVDLGYAPRAADLYKSDNREDEFLAARLLFLLTYGTDFDFKKIFHDKQQLLDSINANCAQHAKYFRPNSRRRTASVGDAASPVIQQSDQRAIEAQNQLTTMALGETLKLLFNLSNFYPSIKPDLAPSLVSILKMLNRIKLQEHPLQPPITYLINALLALEFEGRKSDLFPTFDTKCNIDRLLLILDLAVIRDEDAELERAANPLVTLLRKIYEMAPKSIKIHLRSKILPSEKDREQVLGKSESLASRLLRLTSRGPSVPTLSQNLQEFLFELSGKDAGRFVRNIGYGFAAGFLMSHNLAVPENAMDAWSSRPSFSSSRIEELDDDAEDEGEDKDEAGDGLKEEGPVRIDEMPRAAAAESSNTNTKDNTGAGAGASSSNAAPRILTNPITGQRRDMEESDEEDTRTEDEKIREAERLFHLFERLKATGVVDVENPVIQAAREGRL